MEALIGRLLLFGMGIGLFTSGINNMNDAKALRDKITKLQATNATAKAQYAQITADITALDQTIVDNLKKCNDDYNQLQSEIADAQFTFNQSFKRMQLVGIIILIFVFILFVLKYF